MKRRTVLTVLALALMFVLTLTACGGKKHTFSDEWKSDDSDHWHECTVKKHTDTTEKAGHTFDEGEITVAPTEEADGEKTLTCTVCGYRKTVSIDKLPHTHKFNTSVWEKDAANHWHPATCGDTTEKNALAAHTFDGGTITTAPTEEAAGVKTFTCTVCGYRKTVSIDKLPHTHKFNTSVWEKDAANHWHPATCGDTTEKNALAAHTFSEWTEKTPAAVHADRVEKRSCTVCGYTDTRTVAGTALHSYNESQWMKDETGHWHESTCAGHDPKLTKDFAAHSGDWTVKTEAGYGQDRVEQRDCAVCGFHEERTVAGSMLPPKERTVVLDGSFTGFTFDGTEKSIEPHLTVTNKEGGMTVAYRRAGDTEWSAAAPTEAGTYEFSVELTGTPEWAACSLVSTFRIAPYQITLTSSEFEVTLGEKLSGGKFGLTCVDVTHLVNSWTDWVTVCVPEAYQGPGRHTVPVGELFTDEDNFAVNAESFETVTFTVLDTADFYCGIQDIFTVSGSEGVIIQTVIARGTLRPGDEVYVPELDRNLTVTRIEMNRKEMDKATVGDKISLKATGATREELARGFMLAKPNSMTVYDRFVVTIRFKTKEEGGRHTPALSGSQLILRFTDTGKDGVVCRITLPNGMEMLMPGETQEGVALDFGTQQPGFVGRSFLVIESGRIIGEGTVTAVHNHTRISVLSSGHCSCGYDVSDDLDGTGDSCTSGRKHYLEKEQRIFNITVTPVSGSGTVRYAIALSAPGFVFRVYDGGNVLTPDADGVVSLRADATRLQVVVVAGSNGYCEMTVTKNPPVRLTFNEATGQASSGRLFYTKGSASWFIIEVGAPAGKAMRYSCSLSNSANCILAVYDSEGNSVKLDTSGSFVIPQGTAASDYRMVVTCASVGSGSGFGSGAVAVACQLTVTATPVT